MQSIKFQDGFEVNTGKKSNYTGLKILLVLALLVVPLGIYFYFRFLNQNQKISLDSNANKLVPDIKGIETCRDPLNSKLVKSLYWWDESYPYYKEIYISKNSDFNTNKGIQFIFDHQSLVKETKSRQDAKDIKIIKRKGNEFSTVPFNIANANSNTTTIKFIDVGYEGDVNYLLYYGNLSTNAENPNEITLNNENSYNIWLSNEIVYPLHIKLDRIWALKGYENGSISITVDIDPNLKINIPAVHYEILGTDIVSVILPINGIYQTNVNFTDLAPGTYQIQATLSDDCYTIKSTKKTFYVSFPLFVVWSMDWEGTSTREEFLNSIDALANKYEIPITQLFNPRIYITSSISQSNKDLMTNWVKKRKNEKGDEVGLHIHMWKDMVSAASIQPKNYPQWGDRNDGYDVLFSAYDYNESVKIIKWAINELKKHGFEDIITFRAGGWMLDSENIKALESNKIKIDTSARTKYIWGSKLVHGLWDIQITTKPYMPSKVDINKTNADHFNVWEFPNNGGDSDYYDYEEMKARFDKNYTDKFMNEPQVVTFLSHPHSFNIDYPKMDKLFGYISQFNYKYDKGPIVFITLKDVLKFWEKYE